MISLFSIVPQCKAKNIFSWARQVTSHGEKNRCPANDSAAKFKRPLQYH